MNNYYLIWVAAGKDGQYRCYKQMPNRDTTRQSWTGDLDLQGTLALARLENLGISLPSLSWEDEPVQLKMSVELWEDQGK